MRSYSVYVVIDAEGPIPQDQLRQAVQESIRDGLFPLGARGRVLQVTEVPLGNPRSRQDALQAPSPPAGGAVPAPSGAPGAPQPAAGREGGEPWAS